MPIIHVEKIPILPEEKFTDADKIEIGDIFSFAGMLMICYAGTKLDNRRVISLIDGSLYILRPDAHVGKVTAKLQWSPVYN